MTDILAGNTNPRKNPFWGKFAIKDGGRAGRRRSRPAPATRPATSTPTATSARPTTRPQGRGVRARRRRLERQLGQLAGQQAAGAPVLDRRHDVRLAGVHAGGDQGLGDQRLRGGARHLDRANVDPWTGLAAGPGRPVGRGAVHRRARGRAPCCQPDARCGVAILSNAGFEDEHAAWLAADRGWLTRAAHGPGSRGGPEDTRTAYFYNGLYTPYGKSWGAAGRRRGLRGAEPEPVARRSTRAPRRSSRLDPSALPSALIELCPSPSEVAADRGADRTAHGGADRAADARADATAHARADPGADARTDAASPRPPSPVAARRPEPDRRVPGLSTFSGKSGL